MCVGGGVRCGKMGQLCVCRGAVALDGRIEPGDMIHLEVNGNQL